MYTLAFLNTLEGWKIYAKLYIFLRVVSSKVLFNEMFLLPLRVVGIYNVHIIFTKIFLLQNI